MSGVLYSWILFINGTLHKVDGYEGGFTLITLKRFLSTMCFEMELINTNGFVHRC